jgi:divalent metal cation (Fe/Co/Zn/Cd) transporter
MDKNTLIAAAIGAVLAYAFGWITISHQTAIPGIDELSAVIVTVAVFLVGFSYFKRNPL